MHEQRIKPKSNKVQLKNFFLINAIFISDSSINAFHWMFSLAYEYTKKIDMQHMSTVMTTFMGAHFLYAVRSYCRRQGANAFRICKK